jgi:hypothetical protein
MRKLLIITAVLFGLIGAKAQNPFVEYGYTPKIATLSQGQFNEFFDNDTIVHIGSVLYNTKSREIVAFVDSENLCQDETIQPDVVSRWISPDPLAMKFPNWSPYVYVNNNPIILVDPDGREPIKPQAGTASGFINTINTTGTRLGMKTGQSAHTAMLSLGKTELTWSNPRPMPANTGRINTFKDKYIYTENGGWIDMAHFMFYAGKAYQYKTDGAENPIGKAVQDGYVQEMSDRIFAKHSAYSYEDLPSDKYGADFAVNHFDPNSDMTFGEQLQNYLTNVLKATAPENAPNYEKLPEKEPTEKPSRTNHTTNPVYTQENQ